MTSLNRKPTSVVSFVLLACTIGYGVGSCLPNFRQDGPKQFPLVVEDRYLNFGEVWEQSSFPLDLVITNKSSEEVEVTGFSTKCSCVSSVQPPSFIVEPGRTQKLKLILDLTQDNDVASMTRKRAFKTVIIPNIKGAPMLAGWGIVGTTKVPLIVSSSEISFGRLVSGTPFPSRTIDGSAQAPVVDLKCECEPPNAQIIVKKPQKKEESFRVTVVPQKSLSSGSFQWKLVLRAALTNGQSVLRTILVRGRVEQPIYAVPDVLLLGSRQIGDSCQETIFVAAHDHGQVEILDVQPQDPCVIVRAIEACENGLLVSLPINRIGLQKTDVRLSVKRTGISERVEIIVPISYYGVGRLDKRLPAAIVP